MKSKIKEVQNYFSDKILNGDFEVISANKNTLNFSIDGYEFTYWVSNNGPDYLEQWWNTRQSSNFILLPEYEDQERKKVWEIFKERKEKFLKDNSEQARIKRVEELKQELKDLENEI